MTMEYKQSLTELNVILNYMDKELIKRIPKSFLTFVKQNMDVSYIPDISQDIPINEQRLKEDTEVLLSLIYRDYLVENDNKKELIEKDLLEKQKYEAELREKYNPDNIFKIKQVVEENKEIKPIEMIEYKEIKWYHKIFNKLLKIFKKT